MDHPDLQLREAAPADVAGLATIRAREWGSEPYWIDRIGGYMRGEKNPQQSLAPRIVLLATEGEQLVGFIAGHLTERHACEGELEWLNVIEERRGGGIAGVLLDALAAWFAKHGAKRICVDAGPANARARTFYSKHGARELSPHWMVWDDIAAHGDR